MFCTKCGKQIPDSTKFCPYCGANCSPEQDIAGQAGQVFNKVEKELGSAFDEVKQSFNGNSNNQNYNQGYNQGGNPNFNSWYCNDAFSTSPVTGKSRGVAALLAILLGTLGIHYFYCGKTGAGIGFLLVSLLSCGILGTVTAILALISGIKMFCMTNEQFDQTYVLTTSSMPI